METESEVSEQRAKRAAYMREYTRKNKDKINAQRRANRSAATVERERAYRQAHPDKVREYKKRDREARPEDYARWKREWEARNRDKIRERLRTFRKENPERVKAYAAKFAAAHPERVKEIKRASRRRHPEKSRETCRRRAAQKKGATVEKVDLQAILARDGWTCGICGESIDPSHKFPHLKSLVYDHVIPLSRGGPHSAANLQPAHLQCNCIKGDRLPD